MKLNVFVNPGRKSYSTDRGWLSARASEECDEIAVRLTQTGVGEVGVIEAPVTAAPQSDFFLAFEDDIDWHRDALSAAGRPSDTSHWVILRPTRDVAATIAEQLRPAALVSYVGGAAWGHKVRTALVIRRAIAERLGWKIGPSIQFSQVTEHYGTWHDETHASLASQLAAYLNADLDRPPSADDPA